MPVYRLFRHEEREQYNRYICIIFYFVPRFGYTRLPESGEESGGMKRISAGCLERMLRGRWAYQSLWHPRHLVVTNVTLLWPDPHVCDQWPVSATTVMDAGNKHWPWIFWWENVRLGVTRRHLHLAAAATEIWKHEIWSISIMSQSKLCLCSWVDHESRIPYFIIPAFSLRSICITLIWRHGDQSSLE